MKPSTLFAWFTGSTLVLFAYSGLLKWIPFIPVDTTVLFGGLLLLPLAMAIMQGFSPLRPGVGIAVLLTIMFFTWYAFTGVYSLSGQFWIRKQLTLVLDVIAFVVPILCFRTAHHFRAFNFTLLGMALFASVVVLGMYATGTLPLLLGNKIYSDTKIPDYLAIAALIGCGIIAAMTRPTLRNLAISGAGIGAILLLTARGPLLLVGLLIPISYFACRGREGAMLVSPLRYALVLIGAVVAFTQWEGAEASLSRFAKVFSSSRDFDQTLRVDEFAVAGDIIADHPFLGVGLGGYGAAGYGLDEDIYPHNLFLEAFAEAGVVGVLLFGASMAILWLLAFSTRRVGAMVYFLLFVFLMFSYSKSGGFVGARDLYMCMGVFLAYLNSPGLDDARYEAFGLGRLRAAP